MHAKKFRVTTSHIAIKDFKWFWWNFLVQNKKKEIMSYFFFLLNIVNEFINKNCINNY